ncbi:hypothetical protein [Synechococcus sp. PCC 7336]|uniref:hypothetical protein n=1 Tax=Synechococcus sp. PCC 7336 TaxID=195250 RepID=UPI00034BFEEA|nr:hypothetical protein [Synechococcus sp. PCC 7336]
MTKAIKIDLSQLNKTDRAQLGQDLKAYLSNKQFVAEQQSSKNRNNDRDTALAK